ncbi:hypothetical protein [Plantactinospora soyae]|uniref:Uncharacterized protein n=1 Tax=Plantactinospora soyae TaxID=1544732 RepID=A0A927M738_9ACTN|nr:hypothetical protein [Plantactinospora soyae]MBE1487821.1 hypothetical protein [Plantactinospora soyae]
MPLPYDPMSPEGLVARWVRWVADSARRESPVADETGEFASVKQPDDVWFLAGTFGGPVARRCKLPADRPLFFPAFNIWQPRARSGQMPIMEQASGYARLDDEDLPLAVIGTPEPFLVRGALGNPVTGMPSAQPVSCWGLWGRLDPLPPGKYRLIFGGTDGRRFRVEANYLLVVT